MNDNGLGSRASAVLGFQTIDRLIATITPLGLDVFVPIDHAAGAAKVGLTLRPTQLLIFGNAKGGTPLMQDQQTAGIDLPLKALAWEDEGGQTWLSYDDPVWIAERHALSEPRAAAAQILRGAIAKLAQTAAGA